MKKCYSIFLTLCVVCIVVLCGTVLHVYAQETPGTTVQSPETVPGTAPVQELSPQVQKETTPKNETAIKEPQAIKKEEKKQTAPITGDVVHKADSAKELKADTKSLLSITDGAFRYSRIPGITIKENNEQIIAQVEEQKQSVDTEEKGLFGLSKKASDHMAKIILVVIIIFVFILYRMRTRSTSGSVLRRFPK